MHVKKYTNQEEVSDGAFERAISMATAMVSLGKTECNPRIELSTHLSEEANTDWSATLLPKAMSDSATRQDSATWRPDIPPSGDSIPRALTVAVFLGALGPLLAYLMARGLGYVVTSTGIPQIVVLLLALSSPVFIPYLSFAGLSLGYLRYRGLDWSDVRSYIGIDWPGIRGFLVIVGGWILILVIAFISVVIVQFIGPEPAQNQNIQQARQVPILLLLLIPVMFLVVGPTEEILYRGVIQGRLREVMGPIPAILIASGIFAVAHVLVLTGGLAGRATTVALLFIPAIVFGAVYEYTGNLVVPALLHAWHNSFLLFIVWIGLRYGQDMQQAIVGVLPL